MGGYIEDVKNCVNSVHLNIVKFFTLELPSGHTPSCAGYKHSTPDSRFRFQLCGCPSYLVCQANCRWCSLPCLVVSEGSGPSFSITPALKKGWAAQEKERNSWAAPITAPMEGERTVVVTLHHPENAQSLQPCYQEYPDSSTCRPLAW